LVDSSGDIYHNNDGFIIIAPPPPTPLHLMKTLFPPLPVISRSKMAPWDAFVIVGTFPGFKAGPPPSATGAAGPMLLVPCLFAGAAAEAWRATEVSTIGTALFTQEQLNVASFSSQLDVDDGEDDNKGDNDVMDDDDNDDNGDNIMEEMPMDKWRDYLRSPGQRHGWEHGNWSGPGRGGGPSPLAPPHRGLGGGQL
jgi:hypothetical protein